METKILILTATGLGISENDETRFSVSEVIPNPFSREARIYVTIPETGNLKIEVLDLRGVVIKSLFDREVIAQKLEFKIEGDKLKQGMYFIHVQYQNDGELEDVLRKVVVNNRF